MKLPHNVHCKERFAIFPSPVGMSPGREKFNYSRPGRVWSVTSRLGTGNGKLFLQCRSFIKVLSNHVSIMEFSVFIIATVTRLNSISATRALNLVYKSCKYPWYTVLNKVSYGTLSLTYFNSIYHYVSQIPRTLNCKQLHTRPNSTESSHIGAVSLSLVYGFYHLPRRTAKSGPHRSSLPLSLYYHLPG